jgi:hypothetical protein
MKALVSGVLFGVLTLVCIGGVALAGGLNAFHLPGTLTTVHAIPPLQPLPAQATDSNDLTVTVSERYLNREIAGSMSAGSGVSNVQLDVHSGSLADVSATVQVNSFLTLRPTATILVNVVNGRVRLDVQKVEIGGFGLPSSMVDPQIADFKQSAEGEINGQLASLEATSGLKLQSLSTTENSLTLSFAP